LGAALANLGEADQSISAITEHLT